MSTNAVDWSTLTADPATSGAVDTLAALAAGFDTQVPAVLLPLRVETRFATAAPLPQQGSYMRLSLSVLSALSTVGIYTNCASKFATGRGVKNCSATCI